MKKKVNPDLVILTGDMVSGYAWNGKNKNFYQNCWKNFTQPMKESKVFYCLTLGNHDSQANLNRNEIMKLDMTNPYSLSELSENITGASNYWKGIFSNFAENKLVVDLWFLDSNSEVFFFFIFIFFY